jgi:hypothetical protein
MKKFEQTALGLIQIIITPFLNIFFNQLSSDFCLTAF